MLQFIKLGGSLITDKHQPRAVKADVIASLMDQIRLSREEHPDLQMILGHGSGSYGHVPGKRHNTRAGVRTSEDWQGFVEVWRQARDLNNIVLEAMHAAGLPAFAFPPSAWLQSNQGRATTWNLDPLRSALAANLIPVVNGDVVFDHSLGGTIFSTEEVFSVIAPELNPDQILLCGLEPGVWLDHPLCSKLLHRIEISSADEILAEIGEAAGIDVTGGMVEKVRLMLRLVAKLPNLQVRIFSGLQPEDLYRALCGESLGTLIYSDPANKK